MSSSWDEYLESEEYMDEISPDFDEETRQRGRNQQWFRHAQTFWDWRLA